MEGFYATKQVPFELLAFAAGDGYWGLAKGTQVRFTHCVICASGFTDSDGEGCIELRFFHQGDLEGLPYTDKGIEKEIREQMRKTPELSLFDPDYTAGSEQGMQEHFYLSCDSDFHTPINYTPEFFESEGFDVRR